MVNLEVNFPEYICLSTKGNECYSGISKVDQKVTIMERIS